MVAAGGMDGNARGFGNDYHVLGLGHDGYGGRGYGWFVAVGCVGYYVAVFDAMGYGNLFTVYDY